MITMRARGVWKCRKVKKGSKNGKGGSKGGKGGSKGGKGSAKAKKITPNRRLRSVDLKGQNWSKKLKVR